MIVSRSIHDAFAKQAAQTPEAVAVSAGDVTVTYRELDERANRLAHRLQSLGVGPEVPVAIALKRSPHVIVSFLAVLKAGGFYLPLHHDRPAERQQWIIEQTGARVLLVEDIPDQETPTAAHVISVTDPGLYELPATAPATDVHPGSLAYVMYTSGSTGRPKGVAVPHHNALALALDAGWDGGRHERVLMLAPHAFNVSTYEIWVPLLHGGTVVVPPDGPLSITELGRLLTEENITGVHLTAGLFRVVAEEAPENLSGVREVLTGGDVIAPAAVARVLEACPDTVVRAMYGATEATVFSTTSPMTAPYRAGRTVGVGSAMDGVTLHVLDERLDAVPPGTAGELYIGGTGVSRGYFGRPELTAERFVANPYAEGERMYRTGDLVRQSADGALEFIGRSNDQVKILGFRVEPAEIEAVVASYPGVAHTVVTAREADAGDKRLVAYVVTDGQDMDVNGLRDHARQLLPEYMVPSAVVEIEELPLTANGKVDRGALPTPDFSSSSAYKAPSTTVEKTLCAIFEQVLSADRVGVDDSFFDLGGHSLLAMRIVNRIRAELDKEVPPSALFNTPTVAGLARLV